MGFLEVHTKTKIGVKEIRIYNMDKMESVFIQEVFAFDKAKVMLVYNTSFATIEVDTLKVEKLRGVILSAIRSDVLETLRAEQVKEVDRMITQGCYDPQLQTKLSFERPNYLACRYLLATCAIKEKTIHVQW